MQNNQTPEQPGWSAQQPAGPAGAPQPSHAPVTPPPPAACPGGGAFRPVPPPYGYLAPQQPRRSANRVLMTVILLVVLLDIILVHLFLIAGIAAGMRSGFNQTVVEKGRPDQVVAVYRIDGVIEGETAGRFRRFCREVEGDRNVKAVVLRVNSPGGGVSASDEVQDMVKGLRQAGKTVVVSMGGVAASGGYYVSAPADLIVAEPTTVTGSIGVMAAWPVISGTLEKIGVETVVMKSSRAAGWKDEGSPLAQPQEHHRRHMQEILDDIQAKFEQVVREGRGGRLVTRPASYTVTQGQGDQAREVKVTETEPLNGKVYLAKEAMELGLVDRIGYRHDAIDAARELAGLNEPEVKEYEVRLGFLNELIQGRTSGVLDLGVRSLEELGTPRLLMMWKAD